MSELRPGKTNIYTTFYHLYGYICCMLVSGILTGMPLFGGALYLWGRSVMIWAGIYRKENREYLSGYGRKWGVPLCLILMAVGAALIFLYPVRPDDHKIWLLYGITGIILFTDSLVRLAARVAGGVDHSSRAGRLGSVLMCLILIGAVSWMTLENMDGDSGWKMAAGYALLALNRFYAACCSPEKSEARTEEIPDSAEASRFNRVRFCQVCEWIAAALTIAMEVTVSVVYALLATDRSNLFTTMLAAVLCSVVCGQIVLMLIRRSHLPIFHDPTWLMVGGGTLWLAGVIVFTASGWLRESSWWLLSLCLSMISLGGVLSMRGTQRMEDLMPEVSRFTGQQDLFARQRESNRSFARLLGGLLALIVLVIYAFIKERNLQGTFAQPALRFEPVMILPVFLTVLGALYFATCFPLSRQYIEKLRRFLRLREAGEENEALRKQLEQVVEQKYRQPWLARFVIMILNPFFRFRLIGAGKLTAEDTHSLVFLSNHGELFAPIACKISFPVPFHPWTVSLMMESVDEVADHIYKNTFCRQKWLLPSLRMPVSRFIGWMSVRIMRQIESIPVYRESPVKLMKTIRLSIEALEAGDHLLIFPETTSKKYELDGVGALAPGFVMLAEAYWKRCHKKMRMMPVYADRKKRTISFGREVSYEPENGFQAEQTRIVAEVTEEILRLAKH